MTLGPAGLATARIGDVDMSTMPNIIRKLDDKAVGATHPVVDPTGEGIPPLGAILNLHDFEAVAQRAMVASGKKPRFRIYCIGNDARVGSIQYYRDLALATGGTIVVLEDNATPESEELALELFGEAVKAHDGERMAHAENGFCIAKE